MPLWQQSMIATSEAPGANGATSVRNKSSSFTTPFSKKSTGTRHSSIPSASSLNASVSFCETPCPLKCSSSESPRAAPLTSHRNAFVMFAFVGETSDPLSLNTRMESASSLYPAVTANCRILSTSFQAPSNSHSDLT